MNPRRHTRALAAFDARFDPINLVIDQLTSFETPAQRWLKQVGPKVRLLGEEMDRENAEAGR